MQYIDIDSSYRNRNEFPLPADFDVLTNALPPCQVYKNDGVSGQTVVFPDPQTNPPIVFFEETLQQVYGSIVMRPNLPFMYKTDTDTIVQLDELVLASVDSSTREYIQNSLYPRGSIPLNQADEAYTGMVLEDVDNSEFRRIVFFNYDDTVDAVFQTGTILNTATFGNEFHVYTETLTPTSFPMSNIDRFYQGKYLMMISGNASGSKQLITDYIPNVNQNDFRLAAPISSIASGDQFQIVSDRRWFATIESPFSTSLPLYPSYRSPLPNIGIQFYQNIVYPNVGNTVSYITMATQLPIGIGIGIVVANGNLESGTNYPLADMYYISAADNSGTAWYEPQFVYTDIYLNRISAVRIFGSTTNSQGWGSTPTITYAGPGTSFPTLSGSPAGAVFQQYSDDSNGQFGWQVTGGTEINTLDTTLSYTPPDKSSLVHATGDGNNVNANSAYTNYSSNAPTLYFTYYDTRTAGQVWITATVDSDSAGTTIQVYDLILISSNNYGLLYRKEWDMKYAYIQINSGTGVATTTIYSLGFTYVMSVSKFFMTKALDVNMTPVAYNNGASTSLMTVLPVLGRTALVASINDSVTTIPVGTSSINFVAGETIRIDDEYILIGAVDNATNEFTGCTRGTNGSTAVSHTSGTRVIGVDGDSFTTTFIASANGDSTGATNNWGEYVLWATPALCSGFQGARILQHTANNVVTTYVFAWRQNSGLQVDYSTDLYTSANLTSSTWNSPIILDESTITCVETMVTSDNNLLVVYGRVNSSGQNEVVSLLLNTMDILEPARPYRIRLAKPLATGSLASLSGDGVREIVLPLSARASSSSVYEGTYMHVELGYTYNTFPTTTYTFNDYRLITNYDTDTNTVTLDADLSADANTNALSSIVDTAVWLSFLGPSTALTEDSSGNGYNFSLGVTGAPQYVTSYTDDNDITIENVAKFFSGYPMPSGMYRANIEDDVKLQEIFTWNYVYEYTPLTINLWFSAEDVSTDQTLFILVSASQNSYTRAYIDGGTGELIVELPGLTVETGPIIQHNLGNIDTDTWYHLVISCGSVANSCNIYLNREHIVVNGIGSRYIGFITTIYLGFWPTSVEPAFAGYMKDFFVTAATYTQLQVNNSYYATLARGYYTLSWEILGDVSDYYNPLNYSSSTVLTAQPVCYEMELTHLTLPNAILSTGFGNRIAFYPYIYVEFSSLNRNTNNALTSNNPVAHKVLFKVPIRDTSTPDRANFVNNYSGMRQIVKFQPNDNFHFTVYMYNGEIFETSEEDTTPPLPPNPLLQVSATIGFKPVYKY